MKGSRSSCFIAREKIPGLGDFNKTDIKMDELKHKLKLDVVDKEATAVLIQLRFQCDNIDNRIILGNVETKPNLSDTLEVRCIIVPGNGDIEYTISKFEMIEGTVLGWWL